MSKLSRVFQGLSNGEIQRRAGIPASVIAGYRSGRFQIHTISAQRLTALYSRTLIPQYTPPPPPLTALQLQTRYRKKHTNEISFVFNSLTNSEITNGATVARTGYTGAIIKKVRYSKKYGRRVYHSREVGTVYQKIKGQGIPRATLERIRTGESAGSIENQNKILSVYRSLQRERLLSAGASHKEATRLSGLPADQVSKIMQDYNRFAQKIARQKGRKIEYVIAGMQQSEKEYEDYFSYVNE